MPSLQMALPMFSPSAPRRHHRYVPDTSKAAHTAAVNAGRITGRKADVLAWLGTAPYPVTAAELSMAVYGDGASQR